MRITKETLIRIARETVQKRVYSHPELVAAYLTGSLRTDNPFLGGTTDIDIVFVHAGNPKVRREIVAVTPEIHIDIVHNPRTEYDRPKELRVHPWLGPELYDPQPLHVTQHFFEFVQAGVRDKYHEPVNVLARARKNVEHARQIWSDLPLSQDAAPTRLLHYLKSVSHAANAIALLTGGPLAERRFLLQFPARAAAAGKPELSPWLLLLLGGDDADAAMLNACLVAWEQDFVEAAGKAKVDERIAAARLAYYKLACESILASESPQTVLWPLLLTWTLSASALPPTHQVVWASTCKGLGLLGPGFDEKVSGLDKFLDNVEELLERAPE